MTTAEEKAAYARGYTAGRRKQKDETVRTRELRRRDEIRRSFEQRVMISVLPWVMENNTWGNKTKDTHIPYKTIEEKVDFAANIAAAASKKAQARFFLLS